MMIDYIMRLDALIDVCIGCDEEFPNEPCEPNDCKIKRALSGIPTADVVEVVRCKDCKHRPIDTQEEGNGFDYDFPEEYGCPGYCDDGYYSQRFNDDFYCAWGERADT